MNLLELRGVSVTYPRGGTAPALSNVDFAVGEGERVAIMGPSGSGKSTLLAVLGGMMGISAGSYRFSGKDIGSMSAAQLAAFRGEQVGFVFQNFALLPHLTLLENLLVPVEHLGGDTGAATTRARELLDRFHIAALEHRFPAEISGGQAQRAAIARAMMRRPPLILADEPTGSLDDDNARAILHLLKQLSAAGTTIVVVTHSREIAQGLGRTVHIENGRLAATGQPAPAV